MGLLPVALSVEGDVKARLESDLVKMRHMIAADYVPLKRATQSLGVAVAGTVGLSIAIVVGALVYALSRAGALPLGEGLLAVAGGSILCGLIVGLLVWPTLLRPGLEEVQRLAKNDVANIFRVALGDARGLGGVLEGDLKKYGAGALKTLEQGIQEGYKKPS